MELSETNIVNSIEKRPSKIILEKGYIILKAKSEPRKNWARAFMKMHKNGDDQLLMDDVFDNENFEELS